jgi:hypothetical protein
MHEYTNNYFTDYYCFLSLSLYIVRIDYSHGNSSINVCLVFLSVVFLFNQSVLYYFKSSSYTSF